MSASSARPRHHGTTGPPHRRRLRVRSILLVLAALAILGALAASAVRIPPGERAYRVSPGRGAARLGAGWHLVVPGMQRIARLPSGPIRVTGALPARSRP